MDSVVSSSTGASQPQAIEQLQSQRIEALKARAEVYESLINVRMSSPEELMNARIDLLNAQIELAKDLNERLEFMQQKLDNAKQLEELAQSRKQSGRGNEAEVLLAKANRLAVEIQIASERK